MANIYKDNCDLYRNMGLVPLPANGKAPVVNWGEEDLVHLVSDDFANWKEKYPDANIWAQLGYENVVIDPDGPGAEEFVQSLASLTGRYQSAAGSLSIAGSNAIIPSSLSRWR